jgi:hypothetical protein
MTRFMRAFCVLSCVAPILSLTPLAHANITSATVYLNTPDATNAGDPANYASTLANASFTIGTSGIDYYTSNSPGTTIATFLNNPTFTNLHNGFSASTDTNNSELVIDGSVYLTAGANSFVVGHDDGVVLTIPGIGYTDNDGGPTSFTTTSFPVNNPNAAGLYNFTLDYSECCGGPAGLEFTVNGAPVGPSATPEPSSFVLLGTGILGLATAVRRRVFR